MKEVAGRQARELYERLVERGERFFRAADVTAMREKSDEASLLLLEGLVRPGWVVKLQRDRYGLVRDGEPLHPLAVGRELCGGNGYYVSYGSAMAVWGMADGGEMEKVVTISLTDGRRLRKRTVLGWEYRFVRDAEIEQGRLVGDKEKPVQWKVVEVEIAPGKFVVVSDPEWTMVCGLGRPDLCGGVAAVARGLEQWRERIDLMKLMRYAMQIRNRTAARRLGYLLEELGMQTEETRLWLGLAVFEYYGRLEPGRPGKGELERRWRLDVNN